jgi:hypothetical protein
MTQFNEAFELFKSGKTGSIKKDATTLYVATKNALVIRRYQDSSAILLQEVLAARINNCLIGNSSQLDYKVTESHRVSSEQLALAELIPMIPFNLIREAGLSLNGYAEIDKGIEEILYRKFTNQLSLSKYEPIQNNQEIKNFKVLSQSENYSKDILYNVEYFQGQHFAGARLFKIDTRVFLLDVDRNELQHGLINPFLVELQDTTVKTINEAYESLKPQVVKDAELNKSEVLRQGEWFFIPVDSTEKQLELDRLNEEIKKENRHFTGILRAGNNRPNRVTDMVTIDGIHFVQGTVSHTGREHEDLELGRWHRAIPNTSVTSWTITGDLD